VSTVTSNNGPDRETDPAFVVPPSRDFDGGLLQQWSYTLTQADALALLRLRRVWPRWQRWGFSALFLTWGAMVALAPPAMFGPWGSPPFVVILAGGAVLGAVVLLALRGLWRRREAARMVPHPRPAVFEEWIDCIAATRIDGTDEDYLSPELIGEVILTRSHIFVTSHSTTLVVPTRALPDPVAIATHLRDLARGPYYFDAQD
jgi:hypothetical protein